jgi:hypothetical protein
MQYIKHYYIDEQTGAYCCETSSTAKYRVHPWRTYAGLDVKVWLTDSDGVDIMLSELPDSTSVSTIANGSKNSVQVLTETEYNTVWTPYSAAATLYSEAQTAEESGDTDTAATKRTAGDIKMTEATTAIRAL